MLFLMHHWICFLRCLHHFNYWAHCISTYYCISPHHKEWNALWTIQLLIILDKHFYIKFYLFVGQTTSIGATKMARLYISHTLFWLWGCQSEVCNMGSNCCNIDQMCFSNLWAATNIWWVAIREKFISSKTMILLF